MVKNKHVVLSRLIEMQLSVMTPEEVKKFRRELMARLPDFITESAAKAKDNGVAAPLKTPRCTGKTV